MKWWFYTVSGDAIVGLSNSDDNVIFIISRTDDQTNISFFKQVDNGNPEFTGQLLEAVAFVESYNEDSVAPDFLKRI